ncbi:MAG TPA: ornithine cyclodeaminase family protein [Candidatus Thioglobus sp.]|nr:ornithine cyclodeaminase family protein [Candidatus Thioglobus sp.]
MVLDQQQTAQALPWEELIDCLDKIFTQEVHSPVRHHHSMKVPGDPDATMLLMPAWIEGEYSGVKIVNVFPGNNKRGLAGLTGHYLLSCGKTGRLLLQLDGSELTSRRTAAASALASRYLSRENSNTMLMVGTGRMARYLIPAHMSVRPIDKVHIWGRNLESSQRMTDELVGVGINAEVCPVDALQKTAQSVDLISCATMATEPLVKGEWLRAGTHLDLVGSFTPKMRETNNTAMQIGEVFVDTRAGALSETGDLISPIKEGAITEEEIVAEFSELCAGKHRGRGDLANSDEAITVFKSVGASIEDLAAAILAKNSIN